MLGIELGNYLSENALAVEFLDRDLSGFEFHHQAAALDSRLDRHAKQSAFLFLRDLLMLRNEGIAVGQHLILDQFVVLHERFGIDDFTDHLPNSVTKGVFQCLIRRCAYTFGQCARILASGVVSGVSGVSGFAGFTMPEVNGS